MDKSEIINEGWEYTGDGHYCWLFKRGNHRIQYLYNVQAMYVSEADEVGAMVIYKGKCPDLETFRLIMNLLYISLF